MNTIIQSPLATDPNKQQAFTLPDLLFMEAGTKEALNNAILAIIGNSYSTSTPYVLFGCVRTGTADAGTGSVATTPGSIFYNGEVYTVPAFSGSLAANYLVGTITTTYGTGEVLKDGTSTNVQQINQIVFSAGASGSGTFNQNSCVVITAVNHTNILRKIDSVLSGSVTTTETVAHSFVPSTNNINKLKIDWTGSFSNASTNATTIQIVLYKGGTITGHTSGTIGGSISGGTVLKTVVVLTQGVNPSYYNMGLSYLFDYTGGQAVTITVISSNVSAVVAITDSIDMIADGII
jgi:hypothetical protein